MQKALTSDSAQDSAVSLNLEFAAPLVIIAILVLLIMRGILLLPDGFDGSHGLGRLILMLVSMWPILSALRSLRPQFRPLAAFEAHLIMLGVSLAAPLAAAAGAIGSGPYIDPWLVAADKRLFHFYDWKQIALMLPDYPWAYAMASHVYSSMFWQPILFISVTMCFGRIADQIAFVTAWAFGLLLCVLPFHWLTTQSPYIYYGIGPSAMPGNLVDLPWKFYPTLQGLKDGSVTVLDVHCLTGMVTVPSFHACAATILAWAFWRVRWMRWPFLMLNLAMLVVTPAIGGHYIIDIVLGCACGLVAIGAARILRQRSQQRQIITASYPAPLVTIPTHK